MLKDNFTKCLLFFLFFTSLPGHINASEHLIINTPGAPPYNNADQSGILDRWMKEAFSRINIDVTLKRLPAERSLAEANKGNGDGDAIRISGLSTLYPNLIEVPERVYVGEFVAFSKNLSFQTSSWDSLAPYTVAFIRGHKICEANIIKARSLNKVDNSETLFKLLQADRVDVVVNESLFGKAMLEKLNLSTVKVLSPPLAKLDFYLYLNKKHESIVPKVAEALRSMKQDGTHKKIYLEGTKAFNF